MTTHKANELIIKLAGQAIPGPEQLWDWFRVHFGGIPEQRPDPYPGTLAGVCEAIAAIYEGPPLT